MASSSLLSLFFTTSVILFLSATNPTQVSASKEFQVGGAIGWQVPPTNKSEFYSHWASTKRFHVGDSLRFEYRNDSVLVVDKWGFYHCNSTHPYSEFKDGNNTVVKLDTSGPIYFTSGDPIHCRDGQRLEVDVMEVHRPILPPTPSIELAPVPTPTPTPTPSPTASSAALVGPIKLFSESVLMALVATVVV